MGRGLSDLQRWILAEAQKRDRLYHFQICEGYYRWKPKPRSQFFNPSSPLHHHVFSPADIGKREYARVLASVFVDTTALVYVHGHPELMPAHRYPVQLGALPHNLAMWSVILFSQRSPKFF